MTYMKLFFLLFSFLFVFPSVVSAQSTDNFYKAEVIEIKKSGTKDIGEKKNLFQTVRLKILDGPQKNSFVEVEHGGMLVITTDQMVKKGEKIIVTRSEDGSVRIYDRYRLPNVVFLAFLFLIATIVVAGKKGVGSFVGMVISLVIIMGFIVPQIIQGSNPLFISIIGSAIIMVLTLYIAHGFSQRTTIALTATTLSLVLTGVLATLFVSFAKLSGLGTEDSYSLLQGLGPSIQFQGLLLGGIIIGTLGVLDDTTVTQATTIAELSSANPSYSMKKLIQRGMIIGREHIASLVNTLVLAYAGAGIGVFIYISIGLSNNMQPWWVIFNSELLMEEVVRTIAGSLGLIAAVPITTILAAFFAKNEIKIH